MGEGSTDGQNCVLPAAESLLIQSLVQVFIHEFPGPRRENEGRTCPLPPELVLNKIIGWDAADGRFAYDHNYASEQTDWTYTT